MNTDPTGKKAPAGGFQNGGWYSGYQYYNGSFAPQAGQIHPASPQQGAGQAVSAEVNRQTSVAAGKAPDANQNYIDQLNGQGGGGGSYTGTGGGYGEPGTGSGIGYTAPAAIDLPKLYEQLYASAGISDLEKQYSDMAASYTEAKGKINDNPFLSEATRVGRIAKIESLFNERTANLKNDIATKKADIETQLNLQTKQFDINSQVAQQAFQQFTSLLDMGALNNASGEDIANLTRATGISSDMIKSAIKAQQQKNIQTTMIQYDDGSNQGFALVNAQTGEIIKTQNIASSKPTKASSGGGGGGGGGGLTKAQSAALTKTARQAIAKVDAATNEDKLLSAQEYLRAVQMLATSSNLDQDTAGQFITQAMHDLGYGSWSPKR